MQKLTLVAAPLKGVYCAKTSTRRTYRITHSILVEYVGIRVPSLRYSLSANKLILIFTALSFAKSLLTRTTSDEKVNKKKAKSWREVFAVQQIQATKIDDDLTGFFFGNFQRAFYKNQLFTTKHPQSWKDYTWIPYMTRLWFRHSGGITTWYSRNNFRNVYLK